MRSRDSILAELATNKTKLADAMAQLNELKLERPGLNAMIGLRDEIIKDLGEDKNGLEEVAAEREDLIDRYKTNVSALMDLLEIGCRSDPERDILAISLKAREWKLDAEFSRLRATSAIRQIAEAKSDLQARELFHAAE